MGRLFEAEWLWGMYPELGEPGQIREDLQALHRMELAPMDKPDPELTYIFKHIVTQEVAYESLPFATRASLHNLLGQYIEEAFSSKVDRYVELLAFHYDRSDNEAKKREYLRKAGELAQDEYANEAAIDYYERLLPILPQQEQIEILLKLGDIQQLLGHRAEANELYQQGESLAEQLGDRSAQAWCHTSLGELLRKQGDYAGALTLLKRAQAEFENLDDQAGVSQVLHYEGTLAWNQGDYDTARTRYEESLVIRRELDDQPRIASLLSNLGLVAHAQGDYEAAEKLYEESLQSRYLIGDKWAIAVSLSNMGYLSNEQGNYDAARTQLEVAVDLQRQVGDRWMYATALNNLGNVARAQNNYQEARTLYEED